LEINSHASRSISATAKHSISVQAFYPAALQRGRSGRTVILLPKSKMSSVEELVASVLARMGNGTNKAQVAVSKAQVAVSKPAVSRDDTEGKKIAPTRTKPPEFQFPAEPRIIQIIQKPKTYMDHSYRDFSSVPPELDYVEPTSIHDMTFSQKIHHMLSQEEYSKWISWRPHGRAFLATVPKRLEQAKVFSKYFDHNRYSSFLRQLNNHGFKHVSQGPDRNCFYHEVRKAGAPVYWTGVQFQCS
jgi:hypothetical protein